MGKLVQLEISATNLTLSLREQVIRRRICLTDEFPAPQGGVLLVSNVTWYNAWIRADLEETRLFSRREPFNTDPIYNYLKGKRVHLAQPVRIALSTPAQMTLSDKQAPPAGFTLDLDLLFELRMNLFEGGVALVLALQDVDGLPPGLPNAQDVKTKLMQLFTPQKIPLDVGQLTGLGGHPVIANADIAAVVEPYPEEISTHTRFFANDTFFPDRSLVLIRIEVGGYPVRLDDWQAFLDNPAGASFGGVAKGGYIPGSRSWTMFTDAVFLVTSTRQLLEESFQSSGKFKLQGGVSGSWSAPDLGGRVMLDFYGKAIDACDQGVFGSSDIKVHVTVPIDLSVDPPTQPFVYQPGALRQNVKVNTWKDDWDTALCVVSVLALWPYIGSKLLDEGKIEIAELIVSFALPPLIAVGALKEGIKGGNVPAPGKTCTRPDDDKDEFVCTRPFDVGFAAIGAQPRLVGLLGRPDGLVLMGDFFWTQRLARLHHLSDIRVGTFKLAAQSLSCGMAGSLGLAWINEHPDWFALYAVAIVFDFELDELPPNNANSAVSTNPSDIVQPYLCGARVRPADDPLNVFAPFVTVADTVVGVAVPVTSVPAAYFANPYPCRVLVHTSHGARIITVPAIPKASVEEVRKVTIGAWAKRVSDCYAKSKRPNIKWRIDPSDYLPELHYWEFALAGLRPEEAALVQTNNGVSPVEVLADHQGRATLRLLLSPSEYDGQVQFMRKGSGPMHSPTVETPEGAEELRRGDYVALDVKQTQLLLRSQVRLEQPCRGSAPFMLGNRNAVLLLLDDKVVVYDLSQPARPQLFAQRTLQGVHGVALAGRELVAFGADGIVALSIDAESAVIAVEQLSHKPVRALAFANGRTFILRGDNLEVWRGRAEREAKLDAAGATHLAVSSSRLLLGSCNGLRTFEISSGCIRAAAVQERCEAVEGIVTSDLMDSEHEFLLLSEGRVLSVDTSQPDRIAARGRYAQDLSGYQRFRSLLLQAQRNDRYLRVYSIGATATA